jgi:hypothetical protein
MRKPPLADAPHFSPEPPVSGIKLFFCPYNFGDDHHYNGDAAADDEKTRHSFPHDVKGGRHIFQNMFTHTRILLS